MIRIVIFILTICFMLNAKDIQFNETLVIKETRFSVVHIAIIQTNKPKIQIENFLNDFFPSDVDSDSQIKKSIITGSGVILSSDGYIVTSKHLIKDAQKIVVTLLENTEKYEAKLVGIDTEIDLAVIKIKTKSKLTPILFGDSSSVKVDDTVFAIGNPFGRDQSITQGVVTFKHMNYIQTDAAMNPGNSGGALIDTKGSLIGINSLILSRNGRSDGIGLSIKVNIVKSVVEKLMAKLN